MIRALGYVGFGCLFLLLTYAASQQACHESPPANTADPAHVAAVEPLPLEPRGEMQASENPRAALVRPLSSGAGGGSTARGVPSPVARRDGSAFAAKAVDSPPDPQLSPIEIRRHSVLSAERIVSIEALREPPAGTRPAEEPSSEMVASSEMSPSTPSIPAAAKPALPREMSADPETTFWAAVPSDEMVHSDVEPARAAEEPAQPARGDLRVYLDKLAAAPPSLQHQQSEAEAAALPATAEVANERGEAPQLTVAEGPLVYFNPASSASAVVNGKLVSIQNPKSASSGMLVGNENSRLALWSEGQLVVAGKTVEPGWYFLQVRAQPGGRWVLDLSRPSELSSLAELPLRLKPRALRKAAKIKGFIAARKAPSPAPPLAITPTAEGKIEIVLQLGEETYTTTLEIR